MTTNYPASIDNFVNPAGTATLASPDHAGQHTDINDAVEAIETELGTLPKGSKASVKARLDDVDTALSNRISSTELTGVRPISNVGWSIPAAAPVSVANMFLPSVGQMFAVPFFVSKAVTVNQMSCSVTTAGTGTSTARLGIYDTSTSTLEPSALVADAGTVTCDTTGVKTISSLSISLARGTYWAVLALNSATVAPQFRGHFDVSIAGIYTTQLGAAAGYSSLLSSSNVTGALPSTFSVSTSQTANRRCPHLQIYLVS